MQLTVRTLSHALAGLVLAGCSGQSVLLSEPEPTTGPAPCDVAKNLELTPLDDFESGSRTPFYYFANPSDPSGHTDVKPAGADPNSAALVEVDRCKGTPAQSSYAMHFTGGDYVTYGPSLTFTAGTSASKALDLSDQSGVAFWAKTDFDTAQYVQLLVDDVHTFPVSEASLIECTPSSASAPAPPGTGCYDGGVASRGLSRDWRLYTIDFSELIEQTWGHRSPGGQLDLSRVMDIGLHFQMDAFDVWVDDIALFRR